MFALGFVNYKKGCTRLAAASDKVYQLLAHGQWYSQGTPASSTTKTGRHDIVEILLKVALNTINQSNHQITVTVFFLFKHNFIDFASQILYCENKRNGLQNKILDFRDSPPKQSVIDTNALHSRLNTPP